MQLRRFGLSCVIAFLLCGHIPAADQTTVSEAVKVAASRPHPRLILTKEREKDLKARLGEDKDIQKFFAALQRDADRLLDQPPCERKKIGRRLLGVSRCRAPSRSGCALVAEEAAAVWG